MNVGIRANVIRPLTGDWPAANGRTVTFAKSGALAAPRLSVTTKRNVSTVSASTPGAVKLTSAPLGVVGINVTTGPVVCDQE